MISVLCLFLSSLNRFALLELVVVADSSCCIVVFIRVAVLVLHCNLFDLSLFLLDFCISRIGTLL